MIPRRKEHSNEFRELVIKHFSNGDSEYKIATKNVVLKKYYPFYDCQIQQKKTNALQIFSVVVENEKQQNV